MSDKTFWKILAAADLAPVESPAPFVLCAGLTPTLDALRQGQFSQRDENFSSLWKSFNEWRHYAAEQDARKRLPVFWIEGNPGDGKSVFLLQLLAAFLREQVAPSIAWLEHSPDGRAFQENPPTNSGWFFCAEIPTEVDKTIRENWMAELLKAGAKALVTSGSSETRHGFEFRFEKYAKVTKFALPPFNLLAAKQFAEWYNTRSGNSRDAAKLWREGMSLTEFLFALHHGKPLMGLTSDIRGALGNLGLGGRVRAVWLVNALGLRAPATLLPNDAARSHAAKLVERGVVPVEVNEGGLRLAPPTLAWPLVGTWLGEKYETQHLVEALAFVLKAWLDAKDEENANRFLRQLWGTEWLMDERPVGHENPFIQIKRKNVLRELYRVHRKDFGGQPATATIPTWLEINEAFSLMLLPDPVVCATEIFSKPENEPRRSPLLAAITWLAADSRSKPVSINARKAVADYFLNSALGVGAGSALKRLVRDTKKLPEARALAEKWVKQWPEHLETLNVVGALVKRGGNLEEFLAWVLETFARSNESRPGTPKLLTAILEGRAHDLMARKHVAAWAANHALEPETGIVWKTLLLEKLATPDVLSGVRKWLAANPEHPEAELLRERLLKNYPQATETAQLMQERLLNYSADEQVEWLFKSLETNSNRQTIILATKWLDDSLRHPAGEKMLRLLLKRPTLAVQSAAERWFEANPNSPAHAELLSAFIHVLPDVERWTRRGENFANNPQRANREKVVASLLTAKHCQLAHVQLALRLLPEISGESKNDLETQLGRSMALHPPQAQKVFREFVRKPQLAELAYIYARGLSQIAQMRAEFVRHVLPTLDEETASLIWQHLIFAKARTPKLVSALAEWMEKHQGKRGCLLVRAALKGQPAVGKFLFAGQEPARGKFQRLNR